MESLHEGKLQLLDTGIEVFLSAETAGVLEQGHHGFAPLVTHQRVGINRRLCGLAVLRALMNNGRGET